jgi:hypothetical protein
MKKEYEDLSDFDFGFSFIDDEIEEERETKKKLETEFTVSQETINELNNRLHVLYGAIEPFLDNLCKNPEKSTIYWPDREVKIQAYKKKLQEIVEGS